MTVTFCESDILDLPENLNRTAFDVIYWDPPFNTGRDFGEYDDRWAGDSFERFADLGVETLHSLLADDGLLWLHCDWHANYIFRTALEKHFGKGRFLNEIIWSYNSGGGPKGKYGSKHDTIFVYRKNKTRLLTPARAAYQSGDLRVDASGLPYKKYRGRRVYFNPEGKVMSDVWADINFLNTTHSQRTGYPTQKPVELLERILESSMDEDHSNPSVLDPMCGSGTTGVAAQNFGLSAVLADRNPEALEIARQRIDE